MKLKISFICTVMLLLQSCSTKYTDVEGMKTFESSAKDAKNLSKLIEVLKSDKADIQTKLYTLDTTPMLQERLNDNLAMAYFATAQDLSFNELELKKVGLNLGQAQELVFKLAVKGLAKTESHVSLDALLKLLNNRKNFKGQRPQYVLDGIISHLDDYEELGKEEELLKAVIIFERSTRSMSSLARKQVDYLKSKTVSLAILTSLLRKAHKSAHKKGNNVLLAGVIAEDSRYLKQILANPDENLFSAKDLKLNLSTLSDVASDYGSNHRTLASKTMQYFTPAVYFRSIIDKPSKSLSHRLDTYQEGIEFLPLVDSAIAESSAESQVFFTKTKGSTKRQFNSSVFIDKVNYKVYREKFFKQLWADLPKASAARKTKMFPYLFDQEPEKLLRFLQRDQGRKVQLSEAIQQATLLGRLSQSEKLSKKLQLESAIFCASLLDRNYGVDSSVLLRNVDKLLFANFPTMTLAQLQGLIINAKLIPNDTLITATEVFVSRLGLSKLREGQKERFEASLASTFTVPDYSAARMAVAYLLKNNPNTLVKILADKLTAKTELSIDLIILEEALQNSKTINAENRALAINTMLKRFAEYRSEESQNFIACALFRLSKKDEVFKETVKAAIIAKRPEFIEIYEALAKVQK